VMGHATVGYLFQDHVENGGEGFLIGLHRTQAIKIAQRIQRQGRKDDTNKTVNPYPYVKCTSKPNSIV
jgi:hypothetical protein